jgi:hypothetical protein
MASVAQRELADFLGRFTPNEAHDCGTVIDIPLLVSRMSLVTARFVVGPDPQKTPA